MGSYIPSMRVLKKQNTTKGARGISERPPEEVRRGKQANAGETPKSTSKSTQWKIYSPAIRQGGGPLRNDADGEEGEYFVKKKRLYGKTSMTISDRRRGKR